MPVDNKSAHLKKYNMGTDKDMCLLQHLSIVYSLYFILVRLIFFLYKIVLKIHHLVIFTQASEVQFFFQSGHGLKMPLVKGY